MPRILPTFLHPAVLLLAASGFAAQAAPYLPKSDDQVLERLPLRPNDPVAREMQQLRSQLRAGLAQFSHNFSGALSDLSSVLARDPGNAQARALRATIHIVQARYAEASADCVALREVTS